MNIDERLGRNETYFIAEMSANHGGSFQRAMEIVDLAKESGADCLKLQTYTADTMTLKSDAEDFMNRGGLWDGISMYDLYKSAYTPWEWHKPIKERCDELGLDFLSSPFDNTSVDFLEQFSPVAYKIASFELTDIPLIKHAAAKGRPMIMSTGIATKDEIADAVKACRSVGNENIILLKCCSCYPTNFAEMRLSLIPELKYLFHTEVGLSDHSEGHLGAIAAVALGARVIEKHICVSREVETADSSFSMEPSEFKEMVDSVRNIEAAIGTVSWELPTREVRQREGRRSIYACAPIAKGDVFSSENIKIVRPAKGLAPKCWENLIGRKSPCDFSYAEPIVLSDEWLEQ